MISTTDYQLPFCYDNNHKHILHVSDLHFRQDKETPLILIEAKPMGKPNQQKLYLESIYPKHWINNYHSISAATILAHSLGVSDLVSKTNKLFHDMALWHEFSIIQNDLRNEPASVIGIISENNAFSPCYPKNGEYYFASNLIEKYLQNKTTDFSRLRLSFDYIIKQLPPMSEYYGICIECQNSVINKNEDHLLQTINRHLFMFQAMRHKKLLDDYLVEYIQNHTNGTDYIIIEETKNTQN